MYVQNLLQNMQQDAINYIYSNDISFFFSTHFQMNIVVSLFAAENDEKRVIRFKKIPADDTSELWLLVDGKFDVKGKTAVRDFYFYFGVFFLYSKLKNQFRACHKNKF